MSFLEAKFIKFAMILQLLQILFLEANSHGRLMNPPARNCMWRFGFDNPKNYEDNSLICGGSSVMYKDNGGKCGICGDNYADPVPRAHEAGGGIYAKGIIVKTYTSGQDFEIEIDLTANHMGTFHFKICPVNNEAVEVTQECLDSNVIQVQDDKGAFSDTYTIVTSDSAKNFRLNAKIPPNFSCSHCVLQWTYKASNTWGMCGNGSEAIGCGAQSTFVNCADIAIMAENKTNPTSKFPGHLNNSIKSATKNPSPNNKKVLRAQRCIARGSFPGKISENEWCQKNCLDSSLECPPDQCQCLAGCKGVGALKHKPGADAFCMDQCLVYPPTKRCTEDKCKCF